MSLAVQTQKALTGATVYVSTQHHHPEAPDHGAVGVVLAVDPVGLLLQLLSTTGAGELDAGRLRFLPWATVEYVSVQEPPTPLVRRAD